MSKQFKLDELFVNLGGQAVVIHGGTLEFVDAIGDDNAVIDTLAGALLVEDRRNMAHYGDLAHTEEIDGQVVRVTYGANAERIVEEIGPVPVVEAPKVEKAAKKDDTPAKKAKAKK